MPVLHLPVGLQIVHFLARGLFHDPGLGLRARDLLPLPRLPLLVGIGLPLQHQVSDGLRLLFCLGLPFLLRALPLLLLHLGLVLLLARLNAHVDQGVPLCRLLLGLLLGLQLLDLLHLILLADGRVLRLPLPVALRLEAHGLLVPQLRLLLGEQLAALLGLAEPAGGDVLEDVARVVVQHPDVVRLHLLGRGRDDAAVPVGPVLAPDADLHELARLALGCPDDLLLLAQVRRLDVGEVPLALARPGDVDVVRVHLVARPRDGALDPREAAALRLDLAGFALLEVQLLVLAQRVHHHISDQAALDVDVVLAGAAAGGDDLGLEPGPVARGPVLRTDLHTLTVLELVCLDLRQPPLLLLGRTP
mmetsp:Transcript_104972/g.296637  ORF Transcript_104972/g.296637 Transcript_104972/m.296637 type:complete len:361 (-) Transcript_104972:257-1339(-)